MYTIHPVPKCYAWGSHNRLQNMFHLHGKRWDGPLAEMWFSGHEQSPSTLEIPGKTLEQPPTLTKVPQAIVHAPESMVGTRGSNEFGPVLPFLFKVIAADEPLSLQVHPLGFLARAGFNEENARGIAFDDPRRSFKDTNAKSEMIVALETFHASVGFASRQFAMKNLGLLENPIAQRMFDALQGAMPLRPVGDFSEADAAMPVESMTWSPSKKSIFRAFYTAVTSAPVVGNQQLLLDLMQAQSRVAALPRNAMAFDFVIRAAATFPDDMSVLALLMMNPVTLQEGESVFIAPGMPHAYIHGTGAEIMTNSDNVLRAGMTVKNKDLPHFLQTLDCRTGSPEDPSNQRVGAMLKRDMVFYRPRVREYMLAYGHVDAEHDAWPVMDALAKRYDQIVQQVSGHVMVPHLGPRVVLCTQGAVTCVTDHDQRVLHQGEAVFVPASDGWGKVDPVTDGSAESHGSYVVASTPF